jgi:hypothetical protein
MRRKQLRFWVSAIAVLLASAGSALAIAVITLRVVPSPNVGSGPNSLAAAEVVPTGEAWAVGVHATSTTADTSTLIERSVGAGWTLVPSPSPTGGADVLAAVSGTSASDVWAAGWRFKLGNGMTLIEHFNGTAWSLVPSPNHLGSGFLAGVSAVSPSNAWAVGSYDDNNGFPNVLVEHWNGVAWKEVATPETPSLINQLTAVKAISSSNVWAVGFGLDPESGTDEALIVHWNGVSWKLVPNPDPLNRSFAGIAATAANDVWAVGSQFNSSGAPRGLIEHWNGFSWTLVPSPAPTGFDLVLSAVTALRKSEAWAVGWSNSTATSPRTATAERWDGMHWRWVSTTGLGAGDSALFGVTEDSDGQVWAAGAQRPSGTDRTLVMANCPECG